MFKGAAMVLAPVGSPNWLRSLLKQPFQITSDFPPIYTSCRRLCNHQNEIYDMGTKILYFQCFVTTDMFLFCKPTIFSGICRFFRDLALGSIKTRFKGFWVFFRKFACDLGFAGTVFIGLLPPEGDFSAHIYFFNELLPPEGD